MAAEVDDPASALASLERLALLGHASVPVPPSLITSRPGQESVAALRGRFEANGRALRASRLFATVPADRRLIEGIAWDPMRGRLFASSVVGRELVFDDGRGWRTVPGLALGSVAGLGLDRQRRRLWLASGAAGRSPDPQTAFRGLVALDLDSLRVVRRLPVPGDGFPSDLTVAADGTVFASDPNRGAVYRLGPNDAAITVAVTAGRLNGPQGLAVSPDLRRLYVADYGFGIAMVDLADGSITRLDSDVATMLDGIDGLSPYRDGLIAIQNGTNPRRILHLRLDPAGRRIVRADVLERAHPAWGEPTLGFVQDQDFLYVADAQGERYGPGGVPAGPQPQRPTPIRIISLRGRL